jgi:NADPH:quinone reductase-like Zn-dependent oxidoreductase
MRVIAMAEASGTMRGVRIHQFGGPEVLQLETLPIPRPGPGQLLLKVGAASVNPVDYKIRQGEFPPIGADQLPAMLGRDASGTVVAVGAGAAAKSGEAIYGMPGTDRGAYAEYVLLDPGEWAHRPANLDDIAAAAVPVAGLTAWQGLFDHGELRAGQRVLIHGAAGGVGHLAVQFAVDCGAMVLATASARDLDFVRSLGASKVVDYRAERFEEIVQDIDLVLDLIGGDTQLRSFGVLKPGGMLVSSLAEPSQDEAHRYGVRGVRYTARPDGAQLAEIAVLIEQRKVAVTVSEVFPLAQVQAAQRRLEEGHLRGKLVLRVGDPA